MRSESKRRGALTRSTYAVVVAAASLIACALQGCSASMSADGGTDGAEVNSTGPCAPIAGPCSRTACCIGLVCCPAISSDSEPFCASECRR